MQYQKKGCEKVKNLQNYVEKRRKAETLTQKPDTENNNFKHMI